MKKLALLAGLPLSLSAQNPNTTPQQLENIAQPQLRQNLPILATETQLTFDEADLRQNPALTQQLLNQAIYSRQLHPIETLLSIYRQFEQTDPILIEYATGKIALLKGDYSAAIHTFQTLLERYPQFNPVRIELAIAQFHEQHHNAAKQTFAQAKAAKNLPPPAINLITQYQTALQKREEWQFSFSAYYERDSNINKTSQSPEIEHTGYVKQPNLLPQTAHGIQYAATLKRDFNLHGSHYLSFANLTHGAFYWDNHRYDELTNRTQFGYSYKKSRQTTRLLPFYEKRWQANHSERWSNGVRLEHAYWFSPSWQITTALEYGKKRYFDHPAYNGNYKQASMTLLWVANPQQLFSFGVDFNRDKTHVKQFSSDTKGIRLGWENTWDILELSSRLNLSYTSRHYKDTAMLGGKINLGKIRRDQVYGSTLTLWKRNWHGFGLTPKLQFNYAKHRSNLPTLYAYTEKSANLIIESRF